QNSISGSNLTLASAVLVVRAAWLCDLPRLIPGHKVRCRTPPRFIFKIDIRHDELVGVADDEDIPRQSKVVGNDGRAWTNLVQSKRVVEEAKHVTTLSPSCCRGR